MDDLAKVDQSLKNEKFWHRSSWVQIHQGSEKEQKHYMQIYLGSLH